MKYIIGLSILILGSLLLIPLLDIFPNMPIPFAGTVFGVFLGWLGMSIGEYVEGKINEQH